MSLTRRRLNIGIAGLTMIATIYRLTAGPLIHNTTATMEMATTVAMVFALFWSVGAVVVVGLSMRVDDPTTKQRLRKNAGIGALSPVFVAFVIWITGSPMPF